MRTSLLILVLAVFGCANKDGSPTFAGKTGNTINHEIERAGHLSQQIFINFADIKLSLGPPPNIDITLFNNRPLTIQTGVTTTTSISTQIAK